jgi:hypothetical protein
MGMKERLKEINILNIILTKLALLFLVLWVIGFLNIEQVNFLVKYQWMWFILFVILAIKPFVQFLNRKLNKGSRK